MRHLAPIILRLGLGLVFLWFGFQQLQDATAWVGFLPAWSNTPPISQTTFVMLNGWFEVIFGLLLIVGFYTRTVALLLAIHLFGIAYTIGYSAIGVRDFGLAMSTHSLFFSGADGASLDQFLAPKIL